MKEIKLTPGQIAQVDDDDFEKVSQYRWFFSKREQVPETRGTLGKKSLYMHRFVIGALPGSKVKFLDGNPLNCRKANLRIMGEDAPLMKRHKCQYTPVHCRTCWGKGRMPVTADVCPICSGRGQVPECFQCLGTKIEARLRKLFLGHE